MTWFTGGAVVIVLLFIANGIAYRIRYRTFLRPDARFGLGRSTRVTKSGLAVYAILTAALTVGFGAPVVAPESSLGSLLADWPNFAAYIVWCLFGATALGVALTLCGYPSYHGKD